MRNIENPKLQKAPILAAQMNKPVEIWYTKYIFSNDTDAKILKLNSNVKLVKFTFRNARMLKMTLYSHADGFGQTLRSLG